MLVALSLVISCQITKVIVGDNLMFAGYVKLSNPNKAGHFGETAQVGIHSTHHSCMKNNYIWLEKEIFFSWIMLIRTVLE